MQASPPLSFTAFEGGIYEVGHGGPGFAFDSEGPRHQALIEPFRLADSTCDECGLDIVH
ncbi:hypothetical protein [Rhizobium sp. LjRoot258]|uniref:hypothetical protein n=1 Tax=Rhizobium sp. LjRoot258 TaxID=3342299 RepID=UPI003ECFD946